MPLPAERYNHLVVDHAGRRWSGDWRLEAGEVAVSSAYGARRAAAGRARPETVAARLLVALVKDWRRARSP